MSLDDAEATLLVPPVQDAPGAPGAPDRTGRTGDPLVPLVAEACEGIDLDPAELRALLSDEDVADLSVDPLAAVVLRDSAVAIADRLTREAGRVPASYTERAYCRHCGPIWAPFRGEYLGCFWCHIRAEGVAIPRPAG